jgi:hypothetical protein
LRKGLDQVVRCKVRVSCLHRSKTKRAGLPVQPLFYRILKIGPTYNYRSKMPHSANMPQHDRHTERITHPRASPP